MKKTHWIYAIYVSLLNTHCIPERIPVATLHYAPLNTSAAIGLTEMKKQRFIYNQLPTASFCVTGFLGLFLCKAFQQYT